MNWRRGLFRAWVAISLLWIVSLGALAYPNMAPWATDSIWREDPRNPNPFAAADKLTDRITQIPPNTECSNSKIVGCWGQPTMLEVIQTKAIYGYAAIWKQLIVPPAILLTLGCISVRIVNGFKS
jgi:hypothetical protein